MRAIQSNAKIVHKVCKAKAIIVLVQSVLEIRVFPKQGNVLKYTPYALP